MPKKPYNWIASLEFKEILKREQNKIKSLLENPTFHKEWKFARSSEFKEPEKRQREMKNKQSKFCKKYGLEEFPTSLSAKKFIPKIGPNLKFTASERDGKLTSVKWEFNGKTSQQDKKRMLKYAQQFENLIHGKKESEHTCRARDTAFYDMYYGKGGEKKKGITYHSVASDWASKHYNEFKKTYLPDHNEKEDKESLKASWDDAVNQFAQAVKLAIFREKIRRKKKGIK